MIQWTVTLYIEKQKLTKIVVSIILIHLGQQIRNLTIFTFTGNKCFVYDLYHSFTVGSLVVKFGLYSEQAKYVRNNDIKNNPLVTG